MELHIKTILCPVDFSDDAYAALDYAAVMAKQTNAKLIVLHVVDNPLTDFYGPHGANFYAEVEHAVEKSKGLLAEALRTHAPGVSCDIVVKHGKPYDEILELASDEHADMIVMSTHGWTGPKRLIIGSVAEKVVRTAPCPVLTIRHGTHT
jgi:nucleotide-binding universal stress UspA family protein